MQHLIRLTALAGLACTLSAAPSIAHATSLTTLYNISSVGGAAPFGSLCEDTEGNYYGTTYEGGSFNDGIVYKIDSSGTISKICDFDAPTGEGPEAGLIEGSDGNLYGTTSAGGGNGTGVIFKLTPNGVYSVLHDFAATNDNMNTDGSSSVAPLVEGSDGNFYGTAASGGKFGYGTVFKITSTGTFTLLHAFDNTDGAAPQAGLVQGSPGSYFYGTTNQGGANSDGTVFKINAEKKFESLHSFAAQTDKYPYPNSDGSFPAASLVEASNHNFYSTTDGGGSNGEGTLFEITATGALTSLHSFSPENGKTKANSQGAHPMAGLVLDSAGNFYGTACLGGANAEGTVFEYSKSGVFKTLVSFDDTDGARPLGLIEVGSGTFYGITNEGGSGQLGTIYELIVGS